MLELYQFPTPHLADFHIWNLPPSKQTKKAMLKVELQKLRVVSFVLNFLRYYIGLLYCNILYIKHHKSCCLRSSLLWEIAWTLHIHLFYSGTVVGAMGLFPEETVSVILLRFS